LVKLNKYRECRPVHHRASTKIDCFLLSNFYFLLCNLRDSILSVGVERSLFSS
jgi:hypothetical protein